MQFMTITVFAVVGSLVALTIAMPVQSCQAVGKLGMAIPLSRHSSFLNYNESIDLDTISSHSISVREKILHGLDNYEVNTGTIHPFAVQRSEPGIKARGAGLPLTAYLKNVWTAEISIGTPPQTLKVNIDTGAADMWVLETGGDANRAISGDHELWNPVLSKSAEKQGESFLLAYSDGSTVNGNLCTDNVTIAGFTADPQTFGSAASYTFTSDTYRADGLLGLAFPSVARLRADPLIASLVEQNRLTNPTFSLKLSSTGAEMYFGGTNSMLYRGDVVYTPVIHPGFWQVSMDDFRADGNTIFKNIPVIFDTGANWIFGDWDRVSELYERLGGTVIEQSDFGYYSLPCDSFPTLSLTFGGKTFAIPPEVLKLEATWHGSSYCFSALLAQRSRTAYWNIGMTFLQGVYSVFDYGTLQVGFADLA